MYAMNYLKKLTVKSTSKKKTTKATVVEESKNNSDISLDEMEDLLNDLEVRKNGK